MEISESSSFSMPEKSAERLTTDTYVTDPDLKSTTMAENDAPTIHKHSESVGSTGDTNGQDDCNPSSSSDAKSENHDASEEEWLDIMGSGNFKKKIIKPGLGSETRPNRGDQVTVDVSYFIEETVLVEERKDLKFIVGDLDVIQGLDLVICLMEKGERARIQIPSKLAYGTTGLPPSVPPDSDIQCDVELKEVETIEESLSVSDRLKLGDEKRARGNFFYDRDQHLDAIHCYERSLAYLDGLQASPSNSPEELQKVVDLRIKVYNNIAASHMRLEAYSSALQSVESVLRVQPNNVKALFRKAKILSLQGHTDEAIVCMRAAANLDPGTKIIQIELARLKCQKKKEELSQREMYKRMFKNESNKQTKATSWMKKWSMISGGVLALAIGSAIAYRQYH